ncbi:hypothetical protein BGZ94_004005 [Podila epigama]|nr:hypothetical protein BGZ94_004005 [Podila epigama]
MELPLHSTGGSVRHQPTGGLHGSNNNSTHSLHSLHSLHSVKTIPQHQDQASSTSVETESHHLRQHLHQHTRAAASTHTNAHQALTIDTGAGVVSLLPSPEPSPDFYSARDPMLLESKRVSEDQMRSSKKKVKEFYREQNELIDDLIDPPEKRVGAAEEEEKNQVKLKIAIYGSVGVNILLFFLQLYAAISSKSLSLFATMADSFMDQLSGFILMYTARASTKSNWFKYPSGKSRMETIGAIIFAALMATVSMQLIIESVRTLLEADKTPPMPTPLAIAFVGVALASKVVLFIYCRAISQYSSASILANDHRNDLFVNGFGLFASLMSRYCWWLDAAGAITIALVILRSWVLTAFEQIQLIVGKTADPAFLKKLTYIALTHHPKILQVDTCTAYHAGTNLFVEVDVVMDPETPLRESHDISESLQIKLESLPNVERAFVHVDYETSHTPEHRKLKLQALLNQEEEMEELFDDEGEDEEFEQGEDEEDIVDSDFDQSSADEEPQDDDDEDIVEDEDAAKARKKQQALLHHLKTGKSSMSISGPPKAGDTRPRSARITAAATSTSKSRHSVPPSEDASTSSTPTSQVSESSTLHSTVSSPAKMEQLPFKIPAEIRKSSRKTTVQNNREIELKILEQESRKSLLAKKPRAESRKWTQEELLEEAKKTEIQNLKSLKAFKATEMEKKKATKKKKNVMTTFVRYQSYAEWIGRGPLMQVLAEMGPATPATEGGDTGRTSSRQGSRTTSRVGSREMSPTREDQGHGEGIAAQKMAQTLAGSLLNAQMRHGRSRLSQSVVASRDTSPTSKTRSTRVEETPGQGSTMNNDSGDVDMEAPTTTTKDGDTANQNKSGTATPVRKRRRVPPSQICGRNMVTFVGFDEEESPTNEWSYIERYPEKYPMCVVTGLPAKYKDPATGIPYANKEAYKILQKVGRHEYVWSDSLNAYCHDVAQVLPRGVPAGMAEAMIGGQQVGEGIVLKDGDLVSAGIPGGGGGGYTYRRRLH